MELNSLEQAVLINMRDLPLAEQQSLLDFTLFLKHKVQLGESPQKTKIERTESGESLQKTNIEKTEEKVDNFYKAECQSLYRQTANLWNQLINLFYVLQKANIEQNKLKLNKPRKVEHQNFYSQMAKKLLDQIVNLFLQMVNLLLSTIAVVIVIIMMLITMWTIMHTPSLKTSISDFLSSLQMPQQEMQVAEAIDLLKGLKVPSEEWFGSWGTWPTNIKSLGVITKGKYTSYISIDGMGYKAILKDPNISGEVRLDYDPTKKIWTCTNSTVSQDYLPTACKK
jgi:hypothetical protein